jgi:hypothetical protein
VIPTDHGAIDELLAGYALRSLSGPDAVEADRLLTEHVPGCATCRETLRALGAVVADLALAVDPVDPPETLLPRMHREMEPRSSRGGRLRSWSPGRIVAAAAGLVLVAGLGGLALTDGGTGAPRLTVSEFADALSAAQRTDAQTTDLGPATEVDIPAMQAVFVFGRGVPAPAPGTVYRLWLLDGADATFVGEFTPSPDGTVALRIEVDPGSFERILITEEPAGSTPSEPGDPAWPSAEPSAA